MEKPQGGSNMEAALTREEFAMYIGTMKAIVRLIDDTKGLTTKKLRVMLEDEISSIKKHVVEN